MALKGDLASVGLADVFQMLALNQKVGILAISGQGRWRALYFDRPGVTLYYNEHVYLDRLLDTMVRRHHLDPSSLSEARRRHAGDPIATVESLINDGKLEESVFLQVFRDQMEEDIYDLFLWQNVHWEFFEGATRLEGREGVVNENFFFNADSIVMEAARRLDEWSYIREQIPSEMEVFEVVVDDKGAVLAELDDAGVAVLDLIDGKRNLERVVEIGGINAFHVFKTVSLLAQKGIVAPVPPESLVDKAKECVQEARLEDAILLLERAIELRVGLPEAYLLAAKTYEMQNEAAKACWHYKCYAAACFEAGELDEAARTLEIVVRHLPTDLDAWERYVQVLIEQEEPTQDPHEVGKRLIDLYLEFDEIERARGVLETLLEACPEDIELKKTLIAVHSKAGDTKRVMELYESIADDLVAKKDPLGAVRYLQKILMIDRNRSDVSERIRQLIRRDERRKSRRRGLVVLATAVLGLIAAGCLYWLYDQKAREDFARLNPKPLLAAGNYDGAIAVYRRFLKQHPLAMVAQQVKAEIARIEAEKAAKEAAAEAERRRALAAARRRRKEYRALWEEYLTAEKGTPDLVKALAQLRKIRRLAEEAGAEVDAAFLEENEIADSIAKLEKYLAEAAALEKKVTAALRAGRVAEARAAALRLHREYSLTPEAKRTAVPVRLVTVPAGARIRLNEKPLVDAGGKPVTTPAVVRLPFDRKVVVEFVKDGFLTGRIETSGGDPEPKPFLLGVKPSRVVPLGEPARTKVLSAGGVWYVGLRGGRIVGWDPAAGAPRFKAVLPDLDEAAALLGLRNEHLIVATRSERVLSLSLKSGHVRWSVPYDRLGGLPLLHGAALFSLDPEAGLSARSLADGHEIWRRPVRLGPRAWIVWTDERLWVVATNGSLASFAPEDGEELQRTQLGEACGGEPLVMGERLLIPAADRPGWIVFTTGKMSARRVDPKPEIRRAQWALAGGALLLESARGRLVLVDPTSGVRRAEKSLPGRPAGRPFADAQGFCLPYVTRRGVHHVMRLAAADLSLVWDYPVGAPVESRICGRAGEVFLPAEDGKIHVLR